MIAEVYEIYERDLHRINAMDFDDLLFRTVNLLELFDDVRERYAETFRHVLVDEYQDTNHAQYRLLQLLVGGGRPPAAKGKRTTQPGERPTYAGPVGHRNLAVVGDDSQSIYIPRSRRPQHLRLPGGLPRRESGEARAELPLDRDDPAAANAVIANNRGGIAKRLWSELGQGEQIQCASWRTSTPRRASSSARSSGWSMRARRRAEIAVLYRTNAMSRVLEDTLVRREIAYQVIGGTKFYERAEIKDVIAYLSLLANPFDVVSFTRVANSPRRGIGQTSLSRIVAHAASVGMSGLGGRLGPRSDPRPRHRRDQVAEAFHGHDGRTAPARRARGRPTRIADLLEAVLSQSGYIEALEAERTIEAQGRIENLEQLVRSGASSTRARQRARTRSKSSCSSSRSSPTPTPAPRTRGW